jgi:peptidoglycan/xylan/chitin deacetylase (PgdA/CDA1 family)
MSNKPFFVISLDFELLWGMFDKVSIAQYGANIKGESQAIPEILSLFKQNEIHATWATVGMLMCEDKDELLSLLPKESEQPSYPDMRVSSYTHIAEGSVGENRGSDPYHYGAPLVREILQTPHQELGSHTFSHYYAQDGAGNERTVFAADCEAFKKAAVKFNTLISSIVFPRNQTTAAALQICKEAGLLIYRGTPLHFLYTGKKESEQTNPLLRILRLIDAYLNISGHHTQKLSEVRGGVLDNVQGSRFLRPYSPSLRFFEWLRLSRIKNSMTYAAKHGEIFHLWWHPHNFGINRKENLENLKEIIEHFKTLKHEYGMKSATMEEVARSARE